MASLLNTSRSYGQVASSDSYVSVDAPRTPLGRVSFYASRASAYASSHKLFVGGLSTALLVTCIGLGVGLQPKASTSPLDTTCSSTAYRLVGNMVPQTQNISWNLATSFVPPFATTGVSTIDLLVASGGSCVQVHVGEAISVGTVLAGLPGAQQPATVSSRDVTNQRVTITFAAPPAVGSTVRVTIFYSMNLSTELLYGLYVSQYYDDAGSLVNMISTQGEATYARSHTPCLDEPAFKVAMTLSVSGVPAGFTALSNMPVATVSNGTILFATTPPMSTYLIAFACAPFVHASNTTQGGVLVSVYALDRANNSWNLDYPLATAVQVLDFYANKFGTPYPLPKLDHIGIPAFAAGAMENWGLVLYRETAILGNATSSASSDLQRVAVVVAHESAHLWFGDLVSMDWWSALWLNEGFATRMEYIGVDFTHPEFSILDSFVTGDINTAMSATYWGNSRSLSVAVVDSSAQIESCFDGVSYSYGGSLLAMTQAALGDTAYYSAIQSYIRAHAYANAAPADLFSAFGAAAPSIPSLSTYLNAWATQIGYPIVTLAWVDPASLTSGVGQLSVTQKRHFYSAYSASVAPAGTTDYLWWVPLSLKPGTVRAGESPVVTANTAAAAGFATATWATTVGTSALPVDLTLDGFVYANLNAASLYRVNYPSNVWTAIAASTSASLAAGTTPSLSSAERARAMDDVWVVAEGGSDPTVNMALALSFSYWLVNETAQAPWSVALGHLANLRSLLYSDAGVSLNPGCEAQLNAYVGGLLTTQALKLGWVSTGSPIEVGLRTSLLSAGSLFNVSAIVSGSNALWANRTLSPISSNLQSLVFSNAVRWSPDASAFNTCLAMYNELSSTDAATARRYLLAMAASRDPALLSQLLTLSLDTDVVGVADAPTVLASVAGNSIGRGLAWAFLQANWNVYNSRYGSGGFSFSTIVGIAGDLASQASLDSVTAFYAANPAPAALINLAQAKESIASRAAWVQGDLTSTCAWLPPV